MGRSSIGEARRWWEEGSSFNFSRHRSSNNRDSRGKCQFNGTRHSRAAEIPRGFTVWTSFTKIGSLASKVKFLTELEMKFNTEEERYSTAGKETLQEWRIRTKLLHNLRYKSRKENWNFRLKPIRLSVDADKKEFRKKHASYVNHRENSKQCSFDFDSQTDVGQAWPAQMIRR